MQHDIQTLLALPSEFEAMLARAMGDAASLFPNTLSAIAGLAEAAQARWIAYASGEPLPDGRVVKRNTGAYASSIKIKSNISGDTIQYLIYSDDPKAVWLEEGTDAFDMKQVLATSKKVRISREGKKYLVIPFRFGTRGSLAVGSYRGREMPQPVQTWWLKRQSSMITGSFQAPNQNGSGTVTRYRYKWGDRLTAKDVADLGLDPESKPGRHMVGMVRMRNPESAALGSSYLTFRTMSEASDGWIRPPLPAYRVAGAVTDWLETIYPALLDAALQADVERIKREAGA